MNATSFNRLHSLRMENTEAGYVMDEQRSRFDRIAGRHTNGTAPRAVVAHQLFQTPPHLAEKLVGLLSINRSCRVLEPSAGLGRILDAIRKTPARDVFAIDISKDVISELRRQERPDVSIFCRDFLATGTDDMGHFDAVAMNPPFTMRSDIKHILHAFNFLKPGGQLAALCLDTHHREEKLRPLADHWEKIPAGEFHAEGTEVACILMRLTKPVP